jgi:hypothetical protein
MYPFVPVFKTEKSEKTCGYILDLEQRISNEQKHHYLNKA